MTTGVAAKAVLTIGVAEELLVLGVAVVAEAEFHGMLAHGVRNIYLGLIVLGRVVPGSRSRISSPVRTERRSRSYWEPPLVLPLLKNG